MGISAQILGGEYGLNAQEMNLLLKNEGFLDGNAGGYVVTEKGAPFATETDFHRGCGGYSFYNRYWTQRTWDESIKDVLDVTPKKSKWFERPLRRREERGGISLNRREQRLVRRFGKPILNYILKQLQL